MAKTFTEDFNNSLSQWSNLGYYQTNLPSYDTTEAALRFDQYPVGFTPDPGGTAGWWNVTALQLHKDYPMTIECDVKVASTNYKYWNGIVLEPAQMNYSFLGIVKNMNLAGSTPAIIAAQNEYNTGWGSVLANTTEDAYHKLKIAYSSGTASYYLDGVFIGSHSQTLLGNAPLSLISTADDTSNHTLAWFKNLKATGVFVVGLGSINMYEYLASRNGIDLSPPFNNSTYSYWRPGLQLQYSNGYHWHDAASSISSFNAYWYGSIPSPVKQTGGSFTTSGNALTKPYAPPQLSAWDKLQWSAAFASGTIKVQVCDAAGNVLPDSIVPGNSTQINLSGKTSIDLSGVSAATYPQLSFRVYMTSSTTASSPILYELFTTFSTTSDTLSYAAPVASARPALKRGTSHARISTKEGQRVIVKR